MSIADIRKDYKMAGLSEDDVEDLPVLQFGKWWNEALKAEIDEVNAMTLATVSADAKPSARIVLLKDFNEHGFVFYTNYLSRKGHELNHNNFAALLFFWKELERQVRIEGRIVTVDPADSDAYFSSRPEESRLGAWASPQSREIENREQLEQQFRLMKEKFSGIDIPRPPHWGGYRLEPRSIEFWQGRAGRLHDRIVYSANTDATWSISRLAP